MKVSGKILLFIFILSGVSASRGWATVYPSDGTAASVQSIHDNSAYDGDTITLPAGTFTWSTGVNITKAITLQGNGIGSTIIKDNYGSSSPLISVTLVPNKVTRVTGIELQDGGGSNKLGGEITVTGTNTDSRMVRIDHLKFNDPNGMAVVTKTVLGVID